MGGIMPFYVNTTKCNRDGICIEACGRRIIEMKEQDTVPTIVAETEKLCINCGHCVAVCPTGALSLDTINPEDCPTIQKDLMITLDQVKQFFHSRRSIRKFKDKYVEREKINELIQIAGYAPSGRNARPVRLSIIKHQSDVRHLASLVIDWLLLKKKDYPDSFESFHINHIVGLWNRGEDLICRNAPHLIIAHALENDGTAREDCILALAYMELAAYSIGLGATWAGYIMNAIHSHQPLTTAINLPQGHKCFGVLMVGYPVYKFKRMPPRLPPPVIWHTDS